MKKYNNKIKEKGRKALSFIKYFVLLIVIIFTLFVLINFILNTKAPFEVAQDNDWIGFWGSLVGSIISGVVTFLALKVTIRNERKNIKMQLKEENRLNVIPYLVYKLVNKECSNDNVIRIQTANKQDDIKFNIEVTNIGLGAAINPFLAVLKYGESKTLLAQEKECVLNDISRAYIKVAIPFLPDTEYTFSVVYNDILKNYYEQKVIVRINDFKTENGSSVKIDYRPYIDRIEEAQVKDIKDIEFKRIKIIPKGVIYIN